MDVACSTTCARLCPGARKPPGEVAAAGLDDGRDEVEAGESWSWEGDRMPLDFAPLASGLSSSELVPDLSSLEATRGMGGSWGGYGETGDDEASEVETSGRRGLDSCSVDWAGLDSGGLATGSGEATLEAARFAWPGRRYENMFEGAMRAAATAMARERASDEMEDVDVDIKNGGRERERERAKQRRGGGSLSEAWRCAQPSGAVGFLCGSVCRSLAIADGQRLGTFGGADAADGWTRFRRCTGSEELAPAPGACHLLPRLVGQAQTAPLLSWIRETAARRATLGLCRATAGPGTLAPDRRCVAALGDSQRAVSDARWRIFGRPGTRLE